MIQEILRLKDIYNNGSAGTGRLYPTPIDADTFDFGLWTPSTLTPITQGTTTVDPNSGAVLTSLAPDGQSEFHGTYSKHDVFNADDTYMKFKASGGTAIVEVANKTNIIYMGVDGGGYWSNLDPNMLYVIWNYENTDVALKTQMIGDAYGSETTIHDFTATHRDISLGYAEGAISANDEYVAIIGRKKAGYSGLEYEAIVIDLQDALLNPNQASNIHSRMDIRDNTILDWVSVSQTGDYIVEAIFNDTNATTGNPVNGSLIKVYHNTTGAPTLTANSTINSAGNAVAGAIYMNESHADLGVDVDGNDCYVGFKSGSCGIDGKTNEGGCMGNDNNTFMAVVRLSDGLTQYKFSHTDNQAYGNRGFYGGYVSCRNTKRPGYAYITEDCCQRDGCPSTDIFTIKLDYTANNDIEYFCRTFAERFFSGRDDSAQGVPSKYGDKVSFDSYFSNAAFLTLHPNNAAAQGPAWIAEYPQV